LARAAIILPPQDCPWGTSPLCFFFHRLEGGHELEFRQVGVVGRRFFGSFGERGRGEKQGKVAASSSPASRVQGKKKTHSAVQNGTVSGFFFNEQWMKQRSFRQNTLFHLKGNDGKIALKSKSVFNL
jgi:hypothetical protein